MAGRTLIRWTLMAAIWGASRTAVAAPPPTPAPPPEIPEIPTSTATSLPEAPPSTVPSDSPAPAQSATPAPVDDEIPPPLLVHDSAKLYEASRRLSARERERMVADFYRHRRRGAWLMVGALAGGYAGAAVGTLIGDAATSPENYDPVHGLIGGSVGFVLVAAPLTYFSVKNFRKSTRLRRRLQVDAYATRNGAQIGFRGRF